MEGKLEQQSDKDESQMKETRDKNRSALHFFLGALLCL